MSTTRKPTGTAAGSKARASGNARAAPAAARKAAGRFAEAGSSPPDAGAGSLGFITPAIRERLARLGIFRLDDLVLHLPLRYEDETTLVAIGDAIPGTSVQIEGRVVETKVEFRPRRQLLCHIEDESGSLAMRFFNFYPSQQRALSTGTRVRVIGEIRKGFFGAEMIHPRFRTLRGETPLAQS
ncbi:MAG: OB-fold nucleic acid binding domain-containing protein, partial [Burkholderiales bacterium]